MNFFKSYLDNLADHPDRADMLLLWTISTCFVWFWMVRYRERSIRGMEGDNAFWEGREQIVWFCMIAFVPATFYLLYLTDYKLYAFAALAFILGYQIFGRFIFDWLLAFKGGLSAVPERKDEPVTTENQETPKP